MSNPSKKKQLPPPPLSEVLGKLPKGAYDTSLKLRSGPEVPIMPPPTPAQAPTLAQSEVLRLPRGAWITMRRSGGLKFRSHTIIVYRDGRAILSDLSGTLAPRTLAAAQLAELRDTLAQVDFSAAPAAGRHNPDAFAYEIVARPARRAYAIEVFQGSIPESVAPLIRQLITLMQPAQPDDGDDARG